MNKDKTLTPCRYVMPLLNKVLHDLAEITCVRCQTKYRYFIHKNPKTIRIKSHGFSCPCGCRIVCGEIPLA